MNADNVVEAKGRVACEVDSADELVVVELIFNNSFSDLTGKPDSADWLTRYRRQHTHARARRD
eukprot:COSAG05_NODE_7214_length_842_cov_0.971736_2_plen_63_part_00